MGYTHYWTCKRPTIGQTSQIEAKYQLALRQCQRIVKTLNAELKAKNPKNPNRLSGYSVFTKVSQYGGLEFNGTQDLGHETFSFREHFKENLGFNFCKTARKPYDLAVTACLIVFSHYLGDCIEVNSDGDAKDWTQGLVLAKRVTKIKGLKNPIKKRETKSA